MRAVESKNWRRDSVPVVVSPAAVSPAAALEDEDRVIGGSRANRTWLTVNIEQGGLQAALPDLAAATCVWRDLFDSEENLARQSLQFIRQRWQSD